MPLTALQKAKTSTQKNRKKAFSQAPLAQPILKTNLLYSHPAGKMILQTNLSGVRLQFLSILLLARNSLFPFRLCVFFFRFAVLFKSLDEDATSKIGKQKEEEEEVDMQKLKLSNSENLQKARNFIIYLFL